MSWSSRLDYAHVEKVTRNNKVAAARLELTHIACGMWFTSLTTKLVPEVAQGLKQELGEACQGIVKHCATMEWGPDTHVSFDDAEPAVVIEHFDGRSQKITRSLSTNPVETARTPESQQEEITHGECSSESGERSQGTQAAEDVPFTDADAGPDWAN